MWRRICELAGGVAGLVRAALWPGVALAALLMLGPPLAGLMQAGADRLAAPQGVAIGGDFRVVLRGGALREPPPSVAEVLARLDEALFRTLIDHPEDGHPVCRAPIDPERIRIKARYDGLVRMGLAEYRAYERREAWCDGRIDLVFLTELGTAAKGYFHNLLLELVQVTR